MTKIYGMVHNAKGEPLVTANGASDDNPFAARTVRNANAVVGENRTFAGCSLSVPSHTKDPNSIGLVAPTQAKSKFLGS